MTKRVQWHRPAGAIVGGAFNGYAIPDDPWTELVENTVIAHGEAAVDPDGVERVSLSWNVPAPRFFPGRLALSDLAHWVGEMHPDYGDWLEVADQ